jgi:hypothetical protein
MENPDKLIAGLEIWIIMVIDDRNTLSVTASSPVIARAGVGIHREGQVDGKVDLLLFFLEVLQHICMPLHPQDGFHVM